MAKSRRRRRRLSMTSLIDVIFLLLLFFMLTSTFSKFSEIELSSGGAGNVLASDRPPMFMQLGPDTIRLNGEVVALEDMSATRLGQVAEKTALLVSLQEGVDAQRLTDLLAALRGFPDVTVTVLGS